MWSITALHSLTQHTPDSATLILSPLQHVSSPKKKDLTLCSLPLEGSCSMPWILFTALSILRPTPLSPSWDTEPGLHTRHSRCGTCQLNAVAKCCHLLCFQSSFWWCPMLLPFCLPLHIAMTTWEMRQQWLQGLSLLSCGCQLWVLHHIGTD